MQITTASNAGQGPDARLSFAQSVMFPKKSETLSSVFPKKSLIISSFPLFCLLLPVAIGELSQPLCTLSSPLRRVVEKKKPPCLSKGAVSVP